MGIDTLCMTSGHCILTLLVWTVACDVNLTWPMPQPIACLEWRKSLQSADHLFRKL